MTIVAWRRCAAYLALPAVRLLGRGARASAVRLARFDLALCAVLLEGRE
jgi:hypothetical protein